MYGFSALSKSKMDLERNCGTKDIIISSRNFVKGIFPHFFVHFSFCSFKREIEQKNAFFFNLNYFSVLKNSLLCMFSILFISFDSYFILQYFMLTYFNAIKPCQVAKFIVFCPRGFVSLTTYRATNLSHSFMEFYGMKVYHIHAKYPNLLDFKHFELSYFSS